MVDNGQVHTYDLHQIYTTLYTNSVNNIPLFETVQARHAGDAATADSRMDSMLDALDNALSGLAGQASGLLGNAMAAADTWSTASEAALHAASGGTVVNHTGT